MKPLKPAIPNKQQLIERAKRFYPDSKALQTQWIQASTYLYESGKHLLLTGRFK